MSHDALVLFAAVGSVLLAAYLLYLTVWQEGRPWRLDDRDDFDVTPRWGR